MNTKFTLSGLKERHTYHSPGVGLLMLRQMGVDIVLRKFYKPWILLP